MDNDEKRMYEKELGQYQSLLMQAIAESALLQVSLENEIAEHAALKERYDMLSDPVEGKEDLDDSDNWYSCDSENDKQ